MTIRSKTIYIALHGTIFKVFPDNSVMYNNDKIKSAYIYQVKAKPATDLVKTHKRSYKQLMITYNDGTRYCADLERLILLRTMKISAEPSDDI